MISDEVSAKEDLKREVRKLRKKTQDESVKAAKEKAVERNKTAGKAKKPPAKKPSVKKVDLMAKRKRLSFLEQFTNE